MLSVKCGDSGLASRGLSAQSEGHTSFEEDAASQHAHDGVAPLVSQGKSFRRQAVINESACMQTYSSERTGTASLT